ncbi:hypothetical protein [Parasitella parasitica]|uniref:AMP-dependent synthetase/ligase domain-containing protein n=1 Tax=Parasitella parasitica TaxID=35722 RepID=A0A0B7NGB8_9FUNG|nr:hypothetical protein [Parasitella parasitica]
MTLESSTISYFLLTTLFGAASIIILQNGKYPDVHPSVLNNQSEFSTVKIPGESAIINSKVYPKGAPQLVKGDRPIYTLSELYQAVLSKHQENKFLGARGLIKKDVIWQTYSKSLEKTRSIYSGLIHKADLEPCTEMESSFVGIYASTSPGIYLKFKKDHDEPNIAFCYFQWNITRIDTFWVEMACHWGGLVTIPIAAQAISSHILHVVRNTKLTALVIDETHLEFVLGLLEGSTVKHLIVINEDEDADYSGLEKAYGFSITCLHQLQKIGEENPVDRSYDISTDSIASIYYNTNSQKIITDANDQDDDKSLGVVLTHKNLVTAIYNVLGYVLQATTCFVGGSIAFEDKVTFNEYNLDVMSVLSAIRELKPTVYARYHKQGRLVSECIYDMLVFRDIKMNLFGGNIRMIYLDDEDTPKSDLGSFYRSVLSVQVLKTFSRPETSSNMMTTSVFDYALDNRAVGPPLASIRAKLVDVEKEGYTAEDLPNPRGEIYVCGDTVFAGYWNNIPATTNVKRPDGWYATGVIGELLPNGTVLLLDTSTQPL